MKTLKFAAFFLSAATLTFAATPSKQSIDKLISVSNAKSMIANYSNQLQHEIHSVMQRSMMGKNLSPAEQKVEAKMEKDISDMITSGLKWEKFEPTFVKVYSSVFTQDEVNGLIAFYQSPTGQAFVKKQPEVMKQTMGAAQKQIGPLVQQLQVKLRQDISELRSQTKAASAAKAPAAAAAAAAGMSAKAAAGAAK